jgi:hypothetical protein
MFAISTNYFAKLFYWQMAYFKIVYRYLKIKIKSKNSQLRQFIRSNRYTISNEMIAELLRDFTAIHNEIKAINYYWSLLLFSVYILMNILFYHIS